MMIDEVMYGPTPSMTIEMPDRPPPENKLMSPKRWLLLQNLGQFFKHNTNKKLELEERLEQPLPDRINLCLNHIANKHYKQQPPDRTRRTNGRNNREISGHGHKMDI